MSSIEFEPGGKSNRRATEHEGKNDLESRCRVLNGTPPFGLNGYSLRDAAEGAR